MRIHLDTDIGGDTDDLCALALLLASPEAELAGITTVADPAGQRLAFVRHALRLANRESVPAASGAFAFLGGMKHGLVPQDDRYWPGLTPVQPSSPGDALDLLEANARAGATILAIGPFTNLALLETLRPGVFAHCPLVVMGGYFGPPAAGLPQWRAAMDYNVQADRIAARIIFEKLDPVIVPLTTTLKVSLREADLPRLHAGGPLARLLALQAPLHAGDNRMARLAEGNPAVPADIMNFQYDSLAAATALGWDCLQTTRERLLVGEQDENVVLIRAIDAPVRGVVTDVNSAAFAERWLQTVVAI